MVWVNHYSIWISLDRGLKKSQRWFGKWIGVSNILDKIVVLEDSKPLFGKIKTPMSEIQTPNMNPENQKPYGGLGEK